MGPMSWGKLRQPHPCQAAAAAGVCPAPEVSSDATAIATSVLFDRDSSFLTPEAKAELAELLGTMQAAAGSWRAELVVAVGDRAGALPDNQAVVTMSGWRSVGWAGWKTGCATS